MGSDREESRGVSRIFTRRTRNLASVRNIALVRKSYLSFLLLFFFFLTLSFPYTVKSSLFNLCAPVITFVSRCDFSLLLFFLFVKKKDTEKKQERIEKKEKWRLMLDSFLILSPPKIVVFVPYWVSNWLGKSWLCSLNSFVALCVRSESSKDEEFLLPSWMKEKKRKKKITTRNGGLPNFCPLYYAIGWNR